MFIVFQVCCQVRRRTQDGGPPCSKLALDSSVELELLVVVLVEWSVVEEGAWQG